MTRLLQKITFSVRTVQNTPYILYIRNHIYYKDEPTTVI